LAAPANQRGTTNRGTDNRGTESRGLPDAGLPTVASGASADTLMLFAKGFNPLIVALYNEAHFGGRATAWPVDSWADIVKKLADYKTITRLVFFVHSNPGMFLFGPDRTEQHFKSLKLLSDAAKELNAITGKPVIQSVDLAGCNVGFDLDGVLQFGLAMGATEIVATNHFHEFAIDRLRAGAGKSKDLELEILRLRGYITTPGMDVLVKQAETKAVEKLVLLEWYVAFDPEHKLTLPTGPDINTDQRAKTFKRGSDALDDVVANRTDLDALKSDFAIFGGSEPIRMLRRITIKLGAFRPAAAPKTYPPDAGRRAIPAFDRSGR
jgi:hypothetical protein